MRLTKATEDDLTLMMAWRSNPLLYEGFIQQTKPLTWEEHTKWFQSRNQDWRTFTIEYEGRKIGVVTIGQLDYWEPETGVYIGETSLWGKGIAKQALNLAFEYIKNYGQKYTRTTVLDNNNRSVKLYLSLGFKRIGEARPGESLYRKEL